MKKILLEQNQHWVGKFREYEKREKLDTLIKYLPLKQVITISGIRRCGKSSLLKQLVNHLVIDGVNPYNIFFINLEHPFFIEHRHNADYLNRIFEEYLKLTNASGKIYFLLDEIQFFENWQVFVKSRYEIGNIKFIITGSNSSLLYNDMNTLLSGRSLNIHLKTFSFKEFLMYKRIDFSNTIKITENRIAIHRAMDEYMEWGGFFEVFKEDDHIIKKEILSSYAKNILYQDIIPRYHIRNYEVIERLLYYLISNPSSLLNLSRLSSVFGVSSKTIELYLKYFEDVFLINKIENYHFKQSERIRSAKKVFVTDNGFLRIGSHIFKDSGPMFENFIFGCLARSEKEIWYLKDRYEIDFYDGEGMYQICYSIKNKKTFSRELRAFDHFKNRISKTNCTIVTYKEVENSMEKGNDVEVLSLFDFLMK